jgi:hypothetical protein
MEGNSLKSSIEVALKRAALFVLPQALLYRLWHLRRRSKPRTADSNAMGRRVITIQPDAWLEIYWTEAPLGRGPCVSMFVSREEVLRIDCLGGTAGHMHVNPVQIGLLVGWNTTPRIFFPPAESEVQVDRAVFEVTANAIGAIQTNQLARIRSFPLDQNGLAAAVAEMELGMRALIAEQASAA